MPQIVSIQVGQPATYEYAGADGRPARWTTAFFKTRVTGSVWIGRLGVAGDAQADRENHGGPDKAVLAYSVDHFAAWQAELDLAEIPGGGFGENFSVAGLDENGVCIGDVWQAGPVALQVSQPRQPCWKLSRRWRIANLAARVIACGKSGWYLRVLTEGSLAAGQSLELADRPHPDWSVARANHLLHHDKGNLAAAAELASLPALSDAWRQTLQARATKRGG